MIKRPQKQAASLSRRIKSARALDLAKRQTVVANLPAAPLTDAQAFIAMIERAARDPHVDVTKLKELLAIKNAEQDRVALAFYSTAMTEAQHEMEPVRRDAVVKTNNRTSKYASYEALDRALRPIYSRHGFGLSFSTAPESTDKMLIVTCKVTHRAGHTEHHQLPIPIVTTGAKGGEVMTPTHATMSAKTYGMRGLVQMICNVATTDIIQDDDGNAAGGIDMISAEDVEEIKTAMKDANLPEDKFATAFGQNWQTALPADRKDEALERIAQFKQRGFQNAS